MNNDELLLTDEEIKQIQYEAFKRHGDGLDSIGQTPLMEIYRDITKAQLAKIPEPSQGMAEQWGKYLMQEVMKR